MGTPQKGALFGFKIDCSNWGYELVQDFLHPFLMVIVSQKAVGTLTCAAWDTERRNFPGIRHLQSDQRLG